MVRLHLEHGVEFNCFVDTGSPGIVLPKFLEPQLGKLLFKHGLTTLDGDFQTARIYAAPKIYLGETPLVTGDRVLVWDHLEGILGMDCLRHYCVQLDFQKEKIRFLESGNTNAAELGKAYPLTNLQYAHIRQNGFFQTKASALLIDTGDPFDGMMSTKLVRRAVQDGKAAAVPIIDPRNFKGKNPELVRFPTCVWDARAYTNLLIQAGDQEILGLKFLARHQVTFDFPKRVMYLKYVEEGSR